ncbi:hypothetical protein HPB49_004612 [Dermacentor silvarum]|uniref:Uncharacterized protein n=1 Tax=Dermacentor silvarum TaxID=543639 RepID=A0ACB8DV39_DERSI|nr:hypothetical protein HPB49_004612 [Dermacentor silvarum]
MRNHPRPINPPPRTARLENGSAQPSAFPPSRLRSSTSGPAKAQKRKGRKVAAASHDAAATPDAPVSHDLAPSQAVEIPNSSLVHGEIDSPPEQTQCDETLHTPSPPQNLDASVAWAADEKSPQTSNPPLPLQPQRAANGSEAKGPQAERRNANRPGDSLAAAMTRPSGPALPPGKANFLAHSQEAIAAQLSRVAGAHRVRVNFRLNIVAVDVAPDASLDPLLAVTAICDVPVRATTAPAESCTGYVFGVDPSINNDTLLANIVSDVAVLSCSRAGNNVILRFAGKNLPTEVSLYKLRRRVLPKRPRPRQCHHCGAYGHVTAACTFHRRCLRCGGEHATPECTAKQAKCLNCGGPHVATEPRCPNWQHERKVAETLVSSELPISRRQAADLVRSTRHPASQRPSQHAASRVPSYVQPGRSYSEAAGDHPTRPPVAGNTTTPAPRPPVTSPDSRDAVIALLSAALAYATEFLPQDCPARPLCAAALAAHRALANHGS